MKKENWYTIDVQKQGWPVKSWTFKRCAGQNIVWALFGNDRDGVTPWFDGEQWSFWRWWFRNRWNNFKWYVIGYAWWIEGDPYAAWNTDHLEYCIICGVDPPQDDAPGWQIRFVKPKKRCRLWWKPFICYNSWLISAWIGWKRRGQFAISLEFTAWESEESKTLKRNK